MSAHRCLNDFEGQSREQLLGWLRGILLNDLRQTRRKYRTSARDVARERPMDDGDSMNPQGPQPPSADVTPSSAAMAKEEAQRVTAALSRLSPEDQQVIRLRNWQSLSFAEIGEQMSRSTDAARKLWSRAILRMQKELEADGEPDETGTG